MTSFFTTVRGWFVASVAAAALGSLISTIRVIASNTSAGRAVDYAVGVESIGQMIVYDLHRFATLYGGFILLAFLIAFLTGGLVFRGARFGRGIIYVVAGAVAMLVMLLLMQSVFFGVPIVGGARDGFGLALQMLAGGIGGYIFHRLTRHRARY